MSPDTVLFNTSALHQLIILGNGYDLECGLKSRFANFFEPRRKEVDRALGKILKDPAGAFAASDLTMWDFILRLNSHEDWCDIEGCVKEWVVPTDERLSFTAYPKKVVSGAKDRWKTGIPSSFRSFGRFSAETLYDCLWLMAMVRTDLDEENLDETRFLELLRDELGRFEALFADYLQDEVNGNSNYLVSSDRLIRLILDGEWAEQDFPFVETSILDFNYTDPFTGRIIADDKGCVVNIHGQLGGEVIIGIDGQECMGNEHALPFTKTYRIALAEPRVKSRLFYDCHDGADGVTEMIKFYGHSFAEADYSYFQSIFDGVDLYGGGTKLVFYYRQAVIEGKLQTEEEARIGMVTKVAKLLNAYGKTFDNKDHGKNLMHRLMLEGRLLVKRI